MEQVPELPGWEVGGGTGLAAVRFPKDKRETGELMEQVPELPGWEVGGGTGLGMVRFPKDKREAAEGSPEGTGRKALISSMK